ncbi:hypothetical protein [uncultured Tenacibaculum sp.]|uniref:hypothetical protein n=1 Tax=uncultured Tenacibaculum sp. TaxID=174713 RepID=UPI002616FF20|nr:hypothetical protein [uncultured Tenacibaculum sp.]
MKKVFYLLLIPFLISSCQKEKQKFDISSYVKLNIEKFEYQGKMLEFVNAELTNINDSISSKINKTPRRYEYLLTNRIAIDSVSKVLPDSVKAHTIFNSLLKGKKFQQYFYETFYNDKKQDFTKEELMVIASRFFLSEKKGDVYSTKICVGINGLNEHSFKNKDFTLLEAIVYEAIFERLMNENLQAPEFMNNLEKHRAKAIASIHQNVKDSLLHVKQLVYTAMEHDKALENHLLNYIKENNNNIAINIK